jgi:hypothetical protein
LKFLNPPSEHRQKWLKSRLCVITGSGRVELVGTVDGSSDGLAEGIDEGFEDGFRDGIKDGSDEKVHLCTATTVLILLYKRYNGGSW